ncbi:MAG: adenylyl-sulfate kinase [Flavobacteriales bacterium]|nr:adenylyl-sulfate kinase [Flavobacteriales bacterium]
MNLRPQNFNITREQKEKLNGHKSFVVWLTGFSGSGKSTIANALEVALFERGVRSFCLDGDNTRLGINKDLGFSTEDRTENIRRVAEMAKLFLESGTIVITSFISPLISDRAMAKSIIGDADFVEVFINCPLAICENRDVKGLYAKARRGEIKNFTGIDSPFEPPIKADIELLTAKNSVQECVEIILKEIEGKLSC